jgi:hypothetical protein
MPGSFYLFVELLYVFATTLSIAWLSPLSFFTLAWRSHRLNGGITCPHMSRLTCGWACRWPFRCTALLWHFLLWVAMTKVQAEIPPLVALSR